MGSNKRKKQKDRECESNENSTQLDNVDLYLCGIGLNKLRQMTLETKRVLEKCRVVFHYGEPHDELKKFCQKVVDLSDSYWSGRAERCTDVYKRLAKIVMNEVRLGPGVASITYGHPILFDDVHMSLRRKCRQAKLNCVVLPAVSCLDTLCIDLGIDYGDPGLLVVEASDLVEHNRKLNPDFHTLVMQIGEFDVETTFDDYGVNESGRFERLDRYLQQYYPVGHRMTACYSDDGNRGEQFNLKVGKLATAATRFFSGMTMYIPPIKNS